MSIKIMKKISAVLTIVAVLFSACLKEETVELSANSLEILNDKQLVLFKLDSVEMVPTFAGYRDVYVHYSNIYKTLPVETQKKVNGVALTGFNAEKIATVNQKVFALPQQEIGKTLNLAFAFTVNSGKERSRFTSFLITVR